MYVVKDDFPIEYDGILGVDFLRKHQATCNYKTKQLKVGQHILQLYPYLKMMLKPRSETIIQVATDKNTIGVIKAEETIPGIFIGNCLVEPTNYICAASILNTTDNIIEMLMPQVSVEEIERSETEEINVIRTPNKKDLRKEVTYLGHIITENGILPDPTKLEAVRNFPTPRKVKDIKAFIGLAGYYRKFIENFSKIAKPLTKLTKKENKFEWTQEQQQAFEMLKEKLTTAPLLKYPDFEKEFIRNDRCIRLCNRSDK
ncbi:uncharacterized protein LOC115233336 [Formica exsecta]|uniref:uncharacterized protein LOC115233336 n=1 Tax=Formica exsecta TaxID=72781 RepID=UPI0011449788|nr:uncharacterized protein LOC115233336 [Formica exsecta]